MNRLIQAMTPLLIILFIILLFPVQAHAAREDYKWQLVDDPPHYKTTEGTRTYSNGSVTVKLSLVQTGDREVTVNWVISGTAASSVYKIMIYKYIQTSYEPDMDFGSFVVPGHPNGWFDTSTEVSVPVQLTGSYVFRDISLGYPEQYAGDFLVSLKYYVKDAAGKHNGGQNIREYTYFVAKPDAGTPYLTAITTNSMTLAAPLYDESDNGKAYFIVNGTKYNATRSNDSMTATITGLASGTSYSVQAYATNVAGDSYSSKANFSTVRILSSDATLSKIATSSGNATPPASGNIYTLSVPFETSSLTVFPNATDSSNAYVNVNGSSFCQSGTAFGSYPLYIGTNQFTVYVMAEDDSYQTYQLNVTRGTPATPVVTISTSADTILRSAVPSYQYFQLDGTVTGSGRTVTVSGTIDGISKSIEVQTPQTGTANWSLYWEVYSDNISEGTYTNLSINADHGYSSSTTTWGGTLVVDRTAPTAPSFATNPASWAKDSTTVTVTPGTDSGGAGVQGTWYSYVPGSWNSYSAPFSISNEGTTTVYAYTRDKVGNETQSSGKAYVDKTAPTEPYIVVSQSWTNSDVSVGIQNGYDEDSGTLKSQYSIDGGSNWIDGNSFTISSASSTTVIARSIDKAGNIGNNSQATVKIDKTAPVIASIGGNPSDWVKSSAVTLVVNATDAGGSGICLYSFDDGSTWQLTNSKNYSTNTTGIKIKVKDNAGNISDTSTVDITKIDGTRPSFESVTGNPTAWQNTDVTLTITGASDGSGSGISGSAYSFDNGVTWQSSPQKTFTNNTYADVRVRDAVGNVSNPSTLQIKFIDKSGPYFGVARNTSAITNGAVILTVSGAGDSNRSGVATDGYSFDGGTTWQSEPTKTYTANEGGIVIKVKDNVGNISTHSSTIDITNIDKTKPTLINGKAERTGGSRAAVSLTSNEGGQLFYKVGGDGATALTSSDIISSGHSLNDDVSAGAISFTATSGISDDSGVYDVYVVVKDSATNVSDPMKIDLGAYATSTDNGIMKYIMPLGSAAFNVQGFRNGGWAGTTYDNGAFHVWQKVAVYNQGLADFGLDPWEEQEVEVVNVNNNTEQVNNGIGVKIKLSFVNDGKYVKAEYVVNNKTSSTIEHISLATQASLPDNAGASISVKLLPNGKGIYAINTVDNSQINLILRNDTEVSENVHQYNLQARNPSNIINKWGQNEVEFTESINPFTYARAGVSVSYSWQDFTLTAGETKTYSVLIGLLPNNATTTLTVNDIGTVNCGDTVQVSGAITDTVTNVSGYDIYYSIDGGTRQSLGHQSGTGDFSGLQLIVPELSAGDHDIKFYLMDATEGIAETANNVVTKTLTIQAHDVSFDTNGGSTAPAAQTVQHGRYASVPSNPTKAYYTFDGWYQDTALTDRWGFETDSVTSALTLYAKWNQNYYTLSFDSQGGSGISDQAVTGGAVVGTLAAPTRDGYTFDKWNSQVNGLGTTYTASTNYEPIVNTTIYAIWVPKAYALHFDSQGGNSVSDKTVTFAAIVGSMPASPEKTGYTFGGWFTEPNGGGTQYTSSTNYSEVGDTTLYANWTLNNYTVTFNLNSGSSSGGGALSQTVSHGGIVRAPSDPVKAGYRFAGWDRATLDNIVANTTITAQYTSVPTYNISTTAGENGSISASPGTIYEGDSVTYSITPSSHYHVFDVLVDGKSYGAQTSYTFTDIVTNHAIQAAFSIDTYTVTFEDADGNAVKTETVSYGGIAVAPETHPIKTGFDANGWSPNPTSTAITEDKAFIAQYTAIPSYSIVATAGSNGSISPIGTTKLLRGQGKSYTITPSSGYQIAQVLVDGNAQTEDGSPVTSYTFSNIASDCAISASFTPLTYTVTFKDYDGTILKVGGQNTQMVSHGSDATAPTPTRAGFSFTNWNKSYSDVTSNLEVIAQYKINQYTVTFDSTGANGVTPAQKVDYDSQILIPSTPKKTGYIFAGWYKDENCTTGQEWKFNGSADGTTLPDTVLNNTTLYPKWVGQQYHVSFLDYDETPLSVTIDGVETTEQNVAKGTAAIAPSTPSDKTINGQSMSFKKWSIPYNTITANTVVKALYMATQHAITFDWNYTGAPSDISLDADDGTTANAPTGLERAGYSFLGWYTDGSGEGAQFDEMASVTQSAIYYAKWSAKQYFVKFVDYTGKSLKSDMVNHGEDAVAPSDSSISEREGYVFSGWDKSFSEVTSPLTIKALYEKLPQYTISTVSGPMGNVTPDGNVTVYKGADKTFTINPLSGFEVSKVLVDGAEQKENGIAITSYSFSSIQENHILAVDYAPKTYTVTFVDHLSSTIGSAQTIAHGEAALAPSAPVRTGYNFESWDKATDNITANATITALYAPKKYTVTFNTEGADSISSILAEYGSKISSPAALTRVGYTFGGWYKEAAHSTVWNYSSDTIPANNITLYAKWVINQYSVTFKDYDDTILKATQQVTHGNAAIPPTEPTGRVVDGQNRSFEGWSTAFNSVTSDLVIKALYVGKKHTVTFDLDYDNLDPNSVIVEDSTKVIEPSDPIRTGYTFGGWYTAKEGEGTAFRSDSLITSSLAYYAKWTIKSYTVLFDLNGGSSSGGGASSQNINHGSAATAPTSPSKTGYRFTGWDKTFDNIYGALTVTAQYSEIPLYTISTQSSFGGSISGGSSSVREGSNSAAFTIIASTGYTMKEVLVNGVPAIDSDGNPVESYTFSNVRKNSTIAASFEANSYTVSYIVQNGSSNASVDGKFGSKLTAPTSPIKTGYTFGGWYKDNSYSDDWNFDSDTIPAQNQSLYAKWNAKPYKVSFVSYGAEQAVPIKNINFGSTYGTLVAPTRSSDSFSGWYTGKYGTGTLVTSGSILSIDNDHSLYAKWRETTPPNLTTGPAIRSGNTLATVTFGSNEAGQYYYTIVEDGATPSAIDTSGEGVSFANNTVTITYPKGLTAGAKDIYIIVKDLSGNLSEAIKIDIPVYVETAKTKILTVAVLLNGVKIDGGISKSGEEADGRTYTEVSLTSETVQTELDQADKKSTILMQIQSDSKIKKGVLTGQMVKDIEQKEATLAIETDKVIYSIPASQIKIDEVAKKLGANVPLQEIVVQIRVLDGSEQTNLLLESTAEKEAFSIVVPPISFEISAEYNGKNLEVNQFSDYVPRLVEIPAELDPTKITTAVVVDADGKVRHVPTQITISNGTYYAKVNSLTNSTYSLIWHPIEFLDMKEHWAEEAVNDMGSRMVVSGTGNSLYQPNRTVTRAEFAAMIVNALGLKPGDGNTAFHDVQSKAWYASYIDTATDYGIIQGYGNGKFGPNDPINREQAMVMISKAMTIAGLNSDNTQDALLQYLNAYKDAGNASNWAKTGIATCIQFGIVKGKSADILAPTDRMTRAETAVIVRNLLQNASLI